MLNNDNEQTEKNADETELMKKQELSLKKDNRGIGVVEIVLILVVLIALIIIFKDKIMEVINAAFESITSGANSL
jgi:Flp pilus assembly pilin Flp